MKTKRLQFIEKEELVKVKGGKGNCNCWWDAQSKCEHPSGCISKDWNSITLPSET